MRHPIAVKFAANGGIEWQKMYAVTETVITPILERGPDGLPLIGGWAYNGSWRGVLFKIDDLGGVIWANEYGPDLRFHDLVPSGVGAALAVDRAITGTYPRLAFEVQDSIGAAHCQTAPFPLVVSDPQLDSSTVVNIVSGLTTFPITTTISTLSLVETTDCMPTAVPVFQPEEAGMRVWPNPANDHCTIMGPALSSIDLVDALGRVTFSFRSGLERPIDLSVLRPGLYLLRAHTIEGVVLTARLVVER
jgi:hypothetical protein